MEVDGFFFFFSERAFVVMEQTLLRKDFTRERSFNKVISPFREVIKKRS